MTDLPFVIAHDAEVHIEKTLVAAQRCPELLPMARVLTYCLGGGFSPLPHLVFGWMPLEETMGEGKYEEMELAGFPVFVDPRTLELLRDTRIVLDKGRHVGDCDVLAVETKEWGLGQYLRQFPIP